MNTVSVSVYIPALGRKCDFTIPIHMAVKDVQQLILKILRSEYGVSEDGSNLMLFDLADGKSLRSECSFAQLNITDGAELILM